MKKSLVALAVLGSFAGAAAAQSSATLYGKLDVGYGVSNNGSYEKSQGIDGKFQQWGNSNSTSRWGLKGREDLGNGNAVYFNLEGKISPETGDAGNFDRAAFVGFESKTFGNIQAGRQVTVMNAVLSQFDITGAPNLTSATGNVGISATSQRLNLGAAGVSNYSRINSALAYVSPNLSGFQVVAAVALKNDDILGLDGTKGKLNQTFEQQIAEYEAKLGGQRNVEAKNLYTIGAHYTIGGFTVGAAFESKPYSIPGADISASWGIGAKYDFGSFKVTAGYLDNHMKADGKGFHLGVSAPIGAFEVGAQVAYNTKAYAGEEKTFALLPNADLSGFEVVPGTKEKTTKPMAWELFAKYNLSKRTQLYAQYGGIDNKAKEFLGADRKYSASFGIIHNF